jgi:hypothetical protein
MNCKAFANSLDIGFQSARVAILNINATETQRARISLEILLAISLAALCEQRDIAT